MYAIRSYYDAVWRPDGQKIGYLSSASGSVQLWEMNPDGSGAVQKSDIEGGIFGFQYSPDQSKIYYLQAVKLDEDIHDLFPDLPKANRITSYNVCYTKLLRPLLLQVPSIFF